ncbi:MAG TPA: response regulator [Terriglobales bacterium]|jgi:ActR/RegA family two-component response regulator|nr:response regulator [Terriglobales bacterium]
MPHKPRVLFLDDEESIRATLPLMLEAYGFAVTPCGTVPDALRLISHEKFEVLIADLNVGNAGDGFTVVSAMRRTQPTAVNFILTGYPAFETALEAIRQQVDDYLIKPTEIESLVQTIQAKLADRKPTHGIQPRRLPEIIEQNIDSIVEHWLAEVKKDEEISAIPLSKADRQDHVPHLLKQALARAHGRQITPADTDAAQLHGEARRKQGYSVPLVVREAKILLRSIADCVQQNLLAIQVSYLIPDMVNVWETVTTELEISVKAFVRTSGDSQAGGDYSVVPSRMRKGSRSTQH